MIKTCDSAEIGMKSSMKVCVSAAVGTEEQSGEGVHQVTGVNLMVQTINVP